MTDKKPTGSEQSENQENSVVTLEQQVRALVDSRLMELDYPRPSEEDRKKMEQYYRRQNSINLAAQVYAGAVPLGEGGQRVGEVIVEAAQVIERYLSGNSD